MKDEEIKAIEYLKGYKYQNEVLEAIEIILNLIEKQKAEIEELKAMELKAKGGAVRITLEGLINLNNEIKQRDKEIEKKDKIINEMAEYIYDRNAEGAICSELWKKDCEPCIPCIKEYFENKVKEISEKN